MFQDGNDPVTCEVVHNYVFRQCLESQRRRGYIQQLGDSHNYGISPLRQEPVVKQNDDSTSCPV